MVSTYSTYDGLYLIRLNPKDTSSKDIGSEFLKIFSQNGSKPKGIVIDLAFFRVITSDDIKFVDSLVKIFKLNNYKTLVCGFNIESASILFHFIDSVSFETVLDVESAINAFKNR